jgi:hypothetical protein
VEKAAVGDDADGVGVAELGHSTNQVHLAAELRGKENIR